MKALLTTTMALGVVLTLGGIQPVNAAVIGPSGSDYQQDQIILAHGHGGGGGGHWGGGGGHWHGGGGHWGGHHGYWGGGGWGGGYYGGPVYGIYDDDSVCVGPFCPDVGDYGDYD
jgi:hypothetical protein